jgi:hypothetical protein
MAVLGRRFGTSLALAAAVLVVSSAGGLCETPTEWEVKAAYLYNFTRFVDWPERVSLVPDRPFVVGILGADPFGHVLDDMLSGKTVGGRPIVVRRLERPEDAGSVQILFVSPSAERDLDRVRRATQGIPVLIVGDSEGLAQRGVILNFRLKDNRVRFEVNLAQAEEAHLRISSQLLKLALSVEGR